MATASLTPYIGLNPSFTVIEYDKEYMVPLNSYTYYFDLPEANKAYAADKNAKPDWKLHHDIRSSYYTYYMNPSGMKEATNLMYVSLDMAKKYEENRVRRSDGGYPGWAEGRDSVKSAWDIRYPCMNASERNEWKSCMSTDASKYGTRPSNSDFKY